jgi:phosphonate transport system permease protein
MSAIAAAEVAELKRKFPRAFGQSLGPRLARTISLLLIAGYLVYLARKLGLISMQFVDGLSRLGIIIASMWPPGPNTAQSAHFIFIRLGETIGMAFLGTLIAALLAVPLGFLGARNVVGNPVLHFLLRRIFDFFRGMPSLIWALIFARAVGLGPMTGILAFIAADFAALSKLNSEAIEGLDEKPIEGVKSVGASGLAVLRFGLLPQVLPVMIGQGLYFFESNVRAAAILGIVGAGGIGIMLDEAIRFDLWREVAFIVLLFLVLVYIIDGISRWLRERLIGRQ